MGPRGIFLTPVPPRGNLILMHSSAGSRARTALFPHHRHTPHTDTPHHTHHKHTPHTHTTYHRHTPHTHHATHTTYTHHTHIPHTPHTPRTPHTPPRRPKALPSSPRLPQAPQPPPPPASKTLIFFFFSSDLPPASQNLEKPRKTEDFRFPSLSQAQENRRFSIPQPPPGSPDPQACRKPIKTNEKQTFSSPRRPNT